MDRCNDKGIGHKEMDRGQIYDQIGILKLAQTVPINSATAIDALS
jgi:hypothetical protein